MSWIMVVGVLTPEGVECQAMRDQGGKLYTLLSVPNGFQNGDLVVVLGKIATVSFCMQGTTIQVHYMERADSDHQIKIAARQFPIAQRNNFLQSSGDGLGAQRAIVAGDDLFPWPITLNTKGGCSSAVLVATVNLVDLTRQKTNPVTIEVTAVGKVNSSGWSQAHLKPALAYSKMPADGIIDLLLVAAPPRDDTVVLPSTEVRVAKYVFGAEIADEIKGVRIIAANNECVAKFDGACHCSVSDDKSIPDITNWVGKTFVRIGSPRVNDNVHEQDLVNDGINYRVLTPTSRFGDAMFNPTRLTIRLDATDKIVAVGWG